MTTLLLVHGSAHGAWCWEEIQPLLAQQGLKAIAIDLPGHGQDNTWGWRVTMRSYAEAIANAAGRQDEPVVAVGHSFGGAAISVAAEMHPEHFAALVYLCAFVPKDGFDMTKMIGTTVQETAPARNASVEWFLGALRAHPDTAKDVFYHKLSIEEAERHIARLTPEPIRPLSHAFRLTPTRFGAVPKFYVQCTEDRAIEIADQRRMIEHAEFAEVETMNCGHSPFFERPADLTAILAKFAKRARAA